MDWESSSSDGEWEPIFDVPDNLRQDGSNYVEWIWSLLVDGIEVPLSGSFADLRAERAEQLLDAGMDVHLDEQMKVARRAAAAANHSLQDVITCRRASDFDANSPTSPPISPSLIPNLPCREPRRSREFCREAIYLKADLARDPKLPMAHR